MTARRPYVALLRGINVGGHNKVPMAQLRAACADLGWSDVRSYIQSGNLVFAASGTTASLERALEKAVAERCGCSVPVVVRSGADWKRLAAKNPFAKQAQRTPQFVVLGLSKKPPQRGAAKALEQRGTLGETVRAAGNALWFHFPAGQGRSRLPPDLLDRTAGSSVTCRNWRTVQAIGSLLDSGT